MDLCCAGQDDDDKTLPTLRIRDHRHQVKYLHVLPSKGTKHSYLVNEVVEPEIYSSGSQESMMMYLEDMYTQWVVCLENARWSFQRADEQFKNSPSSGRTSVLATQSTSDG